MRTQVLVMCVLLLATSARSNGRAAAQGTPDGKALYLTHCKKCHGVLGTPPKTMQRKYPDIATFDAAFLSGRSVDSIATVLRRGIGEDMKSFEDKLNAAERRAVAEYVRVLASTK